MKKNLFPTILISILLAFWGLALFGYNYSEATTQGSSKTAKPTSGDSLRNGLVGWYTFDGADVSATTVTDKSGNGSTGTRTLTTTLATGKIGQAFDSKNGYVSALDATSNSSQAFTFSAWGWARTISSDKTIGGDWAAGYGFMIYSYVNPGKMCGYFGAVANPFGCTDIPLKTWNHYIFTYDGVNTSSFYVNGILRGNQVGAITDGANFELGTYTERVTSLFDGKIDDVRIYNRALSASEVKALYKYGQTKIGSSLQNKPTSGDSLQSGLVFHQTFDGQNMSGATSVDLITSTNNGTVIGTLYRTPGKLGQSLKFPAIANNYINLPSAGAQIGITTKTVSFWAKVDSFINNTQPIISSGAANYYFGLGTARTLFGSISLNTTTPTQQTFFGGTYPIGKWFMGVMSEEVTTPNTTTIRLYLNGVIVATNVFSKSAVLPVQTAYILGGFGFNTLLFKGWIDDIRIYNRVLSASEVKALYQLGQEKIASSLQNEPASGNSLKSGLVGWWTFDGVDTNATQVLDKSGQGNTGTRTAVTPVPGKIGQAMKFNGTNSWINVGQAGASLTDNFTLSAWFKTTASTGRLLSRRPANTQWDFYVNVGQLEIYDGHLQFQQANKIVNDGKWHLGIFVANGTNTRIYTDGVVDGVTFLPSFATTTGSTEIGSLNVATGGFMNGSIDDVRIYNRALSATEVLRLYKLGR